jgi:hypothetical protein
MITDSQDWKCGRHSGFPLCCIAFYVLIWSPLFVNYGSKYKGSFTEFYHNIDKRIVKFRRITHEARFRDKSLPVIIEGFGRVACPLCLLFSRNTEWKECDCGW